MGKEFVGEGYGIPAQRDRGEISRTVGVTCGSNSEELLEKDHQGPRSSTAGSLRSKRPGQRPTKYVDRDRVSTEKERWPLLVAMQRERTLGFKSGR